MLLGFKRRFAPFVKDGTKTHTIRRKRKIAPRPGEVCHCYVDPRQKSMRLLGRFVCTKVDDIRIQVCFTAHGPDSVYMWINDNRLDHDEMNQLCWRDGFRPVRRIDAWIAFAHCWKEMHGLRDFHGDLIHWRYKEGSRDAATKPKKAA